MSKKMSSDAKCFVPAAEIKAEMDVIEAAYFEAEEFEAHMAEFEDATIDFDSCYYPLPI